MKWEYIGTQDLPNRKGKPTWVHPEMWRSRVPGGWLILFITNLEIKSSSFYPDPEHVWEAESEDADSASKILLRPAGEPPLLTEE